MAQQGHRLPPLSSPLVGRLSICRTGQRSRISSARSRPSGVQLSRICPVAFPGSECQVYATTALAGSVWRTSTTSMVSSGGDAGVEPSHVVGGELLGVHGAERTAVYS
jgi:hypothetical protein